MIKSLLQVSCTALACALAIPASAHDIETKADDKVDASFDITRASATTDGHIINFAMELTGKPGTKSPEAIGKLPGAKVESYVWVTKLDPAAAGFAKGSGLLALAVTAHPDFDDTPLFDENGDGNTANDGANWHSHWVVLGEEKACGAGLKVLDIAPGTDVLPNTAPGLPLALDSPGYSPLLGDTSLKVNAAAAGGEGVNFDAVTAQLQVNGEGKAPLLCVTAVRKVASGNLSFPGMITKSK